MANPPRLAIVIPCYNEEEVLPETTKRLIPLVAEMVQSHLIAKDSYVLFVDDGSKDKTWDLITQYHLDNPLFNGVKLSRNRGHQNALLAGLMSAKESCDISISVDADLQDDLNAMREMVVAYQNGAQIVYGVRSSRKTDSFMKRFTAQSFYRVMQSLGTKTIYNHADYRLMSRSVLEHLSTFKEVHLFLRGLLPLIGFKTDIVYYERNVRFAGESKYSIKKMLAFAWDGITSFSTEPIHWISRLGFFLLTLVGITLVTSLVLTFFFNVPWPTIALYTTIVGLSAIQLIAIGLVGEYVGKMYGEVKARPRYIIEAVLMHTKKATDL